MEKTAAKLEVKVGASRIGVAVREGTLLPTADGAACCCCCCSSCSSKAR